MSKNHGRFSPLMKQCFVTGALCANIICHGCTMGFPAVLLPQLQLPHSPIHADNDAQSWIASITAISMLLGNFLTPPIMERFGRKAAHYAVLAPICLGWFLAILASTVAELLIARTLQGLSVGMMMTLRSVLIGEYTSPKHRGALLTMVSLSQAFGIFFVHAVGSLLSWQRTALVSVFFSFISLLMTIYCPESPSWLAARGRYDECRTTFRWLRGDEEDEELNEMIEASILIEYEKNDSKQSKSLKSQINEMILVIRKKEFYKPIILMSHAYFMTQFAGGTVMAAYSTKIIGLLIGVNANVNFWMVALDTQRIFSNAIAVYVINKTKRRTMMFATGGLCVISHLAISTYLYLKLNGTLPYDGQWIPILLLNIQFLSVATGMVPLPSVIAGEVFPLQYRGVGSSISVVSLAGWLFIVLKTFPALVSWLGLHGTYVLYAGVLSYNLVVIWYMLPETHGRTLQQIEGDWRGDLKEVEREESPLKRDSVTKYKRRISQRRCSSPLLC